MARPACPPFSRSYHRNEVHQQTRDPFACRQFRFVVPRPVSTRLSSTATTFIRLKIRKRFALSTGTSAATISTTAKLLSVSDFSDEAQPLDATRVRVESRMLSPTRLTDRAYDLELADSLIRDDAERLIESVRLTAGEEARAVADGDKWKVIITKQTRAEVEDTKAKLDDAGFEVLSTKEASPVNQPSAKTDASQTAKASTSPSKLKLTSRALSSSREVIAFARGAAPTLRS